MPDKLYLAAPLFSDAERDFNDRLAARLLPWFDVFLPQRDGELITDLLRSGLDRALAKEIIFKTDVGAIQRADLVLGVLDGASVDEGVAVELALGFAWKKECWSLKTDFRSLASFGDNPMVEGLIRKRFESVDSLIAHVSKSCVPSVCPIAGITYNAQQA